MPPKNQKSFSSIKANRSINNPPQINNISQINIDRISDVVEIDNSSPIHTSTTYNSDDNKKYLSLLKDINNNIIKYQSNCSLKYPPPYIKTFNRIKETKI
jgi:hypothetical protein